MPQIKGDSIYLDIDGEANVRLDLFPRDQPLDIDLIITGTQITDNEDDSTDMVNAYFRASKQQPDGSWKEMRGNDFSYAFQRQAQPQLDALGQEHSGPWLCNQQHDYKYTHIPLHLPRELNKDIFKNPLGKKDV